jgi:glucose-6-phosphate dehydrogenase assembly protein OpcA
VTAARDGLVPLEEREHGDLDVSRLRSDMIALWREEGAASTGGKAVTRACLSTLVVPDGSGEDEDGDGLLSDLLSLRPSRAILIHSDPGRPPGSVDAWVGGACFRRADGGSLVCSEVVHMTAGPDTGARLASAVRSLRVGGVPLFVVAPWTSPTAIDWLGRLDAVVDAVLGDSGPLPAAEARALWRRCADGGEPRWGDFLWEDLEDWRRAVASWFDRPGQGPKLAALNAVTIETAEGREGLHKGLLLAGWFASRLGWTANATEDPRAMRFTAASRPVSVAIRSGNGEEDGSRIRSVSLGLRDGETFRWRRPSGETCLVVETGGRVRLRLNRTKRPPAVVMLDFLRRPGPDPVAVDAMRTAIGLGETER